MAKKKKSKSKKPSSAKVDSGTTTAEIVTDKKLSPESSPTEFNKTTINVKKGEVDAASTKLDDESALGMEKLTVKQQEEEVDSNVTSVKIPTTLENEVDVMTENNEKASIPVVVPTSTTGHSKWGLLPDVESSDDDSDEDVEKDANVGTDLQEVEKSIDNPEGCVASVVQEEDGVQHENAPSSTQVASSGAVEEQSVTPKWRAHLSDDETDSDSDDDALISPYMLKKQADSAAHCKPNNKQDAASEQVIPVNSKELSLSEKKKFKDGESIIPPKISLEEDGYNQDDRGIRSGNMYLQNIKKDEFPKEEGSIFRPESSVSVRLAGVKSNLESRVISARQKQEEEERKVQERRRSSASIQWSYMKKEKKFQDCDEAPVPTQQNEQVDIQQTSSSTDSSDIVREEEGNEKEKEEEEEKKEEKELTSQTWAPRVLSLDGSDSESDSDSSDDDQLIVPRRYGN